MKEMVAKFAKDQIGPLVKEMDAKAETDMGIIQALFDNGVRFQRTTHLGWLHLAQTEVAYQA